MICALMLARNEGWIIGYSARAALRCCNHLLICCHACTDLTFDIACEVAEEHPSRVTVMTRSDAEFDEMDIRQAMLERARSLGATRIVINDADEILTAALLPDMRRRIQLLPPGGVLVCPIHNLWRSLDRYRNDERPFGNGWVVLAFGDHPGVAWRPAEDGYQFHQRLPHGQWLSPLRWPLERERGGLMHLQHASWRRLVAKHDLYRITEALRWPHRDRAEIVKLYSRALDETGIRILDVPSAWWAHGLDRRLIDLEAAPWQAAEVERLLARYGPAAFADLNLSCLSGTGTL